VVVLLLTKQSVEKQPIKNTLRKRSIIELLLSVALVILVLYISSLAFFRIDLTSEKRYTISPITKNTLNNLDDLVYIKIYLDGEMPLQFKKMKRTINELLDEYEVYGKDNLEFEFINPYESRDKNIQKELINYLMKSGIQPVNIKLAGTDGESSENLVFPGAIITFKGIELGLNLLKNNPSVDPEVNLNNSMQDLEYAFTSTIKNLSEKKLNKIAFLEGQGELNELETGDLLKSLANSYQVDFGAVHGKVGSLDNYLAVVIAQPKSRFSEADKFVIDQYIMNGGKVAWFVDAVNVSLDSMINGRTLAFISDLNLEDQLFRYGVRVNPVLVQDIQCNVIPVNVSAPGSNSRFVPAPWLYYPLFSAGSHPVTNGLGMIWGRFTNTIDTLGNDGVRKKILLTTSQMSKTLAAPLMIDLAEVAKVPVQEEFNKPFMPVAVLLQGEFQSVFKNRSVNEFMNGTHYTFKDKSTATKMAIIADGDMLRNDVSITPSGPRISELGYDRYTQQTFDNKSFVLNLINFLTDDEGMMQLRTRELKIRLLDKSAINKNRGVYQVIIVILPVFLTILAGVLFFYWRRRRYAKQ
jgi:ABC-2 type transport system permease protein